MQLEIRRMVGDDIDSVLEVEKASFLTPWSRQAFVSELANQGFTQYFVALAEDQVVGYAGMWIIIDEAHITNIAVRPQQRGKKIGEALLIKILEESERAGCTGITLEVRISNETAQNLYRKFGFQVQGIRKGYYTDTHEDALIMWKWICKAGKEK